MNIDDRLRNMVEIQKDILDKVVGQLEQINLCLSTKTEDTFEKIGWLIDDTVFTSDPEVAHVHRDDGRKVVRIFTKRE